MGIVDSIRDDVAERFGCSPMTAGVDMVGDRQCVSTQDVVLEPRQRWAIPVHVVDGFGRKSSLPNLDKDVVQDNARGRWRYEAEPVLHACQNGIVTPRATLPQGTESCSVIVSNWSDEEVKIPVGTPLLTIAREPTPVVENGPTRQISSVIKEAVEQVRSLEGLSHATDLEGEMWWDKEVLLNQSMNFGGVQQQERMRAWAERRKPFGLAALQQVSQTGEELEPWREAGYRVTKVGDTAQLFKRKGRRGMRASQKDMRKNSRGLWLIEKQFLVNSDVGGGNDLQDKTKAIRVMLNKFYDPKKWENRVKELQQMMRERTGDDGASLTEAEVEEVVEALTPFSDIFDPRTDSCVIRY